MVHVDPARLCQVVRNIVANAIKFSEAGGRVEARSRRVGSHVEIGVADQGIGMAPDLLPRIFDRFQQADSSTTRRTGGMGIGLSIAKHIIEAHGGQIRAHSPGPGKGATFIVRLPIAADLDTAVRTETGTALPSLSGSRLLVVDDDADALAMMKRALEEVGAEVQTADNARDALEVLAGQRPNLVVSDIGMPTEDGYTLVRKIRELKAPLSATPALALSAFARPEDHQKALLAGFNGHLGKPVDAAQLIRAAASLLGPQRQ